jgi:hypothetical protein
MGIFRFAIRRNCRHHETHAPSPCAELQATRAQGAIKGQACSSGLPKLITGGKRGRRKPALFILLLFADAPDQGAGCRKRRSQDTRVSAAVNQQALASDVSGLC